MGGAVRRIVTGHDGAGRSVIQEDGPPARVATLGGEFGTTFHELWNTRATPAPIDRASDEAAEPGISLLPPKGGTRIRILDIPPDDGTVESLPREAVRALFEAIGAGHALAEDPPHPLMHRTETIDYGIMLEGELVLILDEGRDDRPGRRRRRPARHQPRLGQPLERPCEDRLRPDRRPVRGGAGRLMWLHYFKMCFRSMRSERFLSAINLAGLAAGLASVILIFLHVTAEYSHDRWIPGHERLYRIDTVETVPGQEPNEIALAPGPIRDALLKDFPEIEEIARGHVAPLTVARDGQSFREEIFVADPNFFTLIGLPFQSGAPGQALRDPASVALSARAAAKFFGDSDPVGRRLVILTPEPRDFVVTAVFETIPHNSHMKFDIVIPHNGYFPLGDEETRSIPEAWGGAYFHTYARLKAGADLAAIERRLPDFVDRSLPSWLTGLLKTAPHDFFKFRFIPIRDVHFDGAPLAAMKPPASRTTILALSLVALLILLIAAINFANLSAARSTLRAREVALRKTVGARRGQIFAQFLVEAVTLTAIAALLGLGLAQLALPWLGDWLGLERGAAVPSYWALWALLGGAIALTALGSGLYPSVVAAGIRPAAVFNRGASGIVGGRLRTALVVAQFAISIALIATTIVIVLQTRFARDVDLGFDRADMLIVRAPAGADGAALAAAFRDEAARRPDVIAAALSSAVPSDLSEDNISIDRPGSAKPVQLGFHRVDFELLPDLWRPAAGRPHRQPPPGGGGDGRGRRDRRQQGRFGPARLSRPGPPARRGRPLGDPGLHHRRRGSRSPFPLPPPAGAAGNLRPRRCARNGRLDPLPDRRPPRLPRRDRPDVEPPPSGPRGRTGVPRRVARPALPTRERAGRPAQPVLGRRHPRLLPRSARHGGLHRPAADPGDRHPQGARRPVGRYLQAPALAVPQAGRRRQSDRLAGRFPRRQAVARPLRLPDRPADLGLPARQPRGGPRRRRGGRRAQLQGRPNQPGDRPEI